MPLCLKNQFITSWFFVAATPFVLPVIYATLSLYPTVKHSVEFFRVSMNIKIFPPSLVLSLSSPGPLSVPSFGLDFSVLDLHTSNQRNWDRCLHFLFCKTAIFLLSEKIDQAKHQVLMPTPGLLPVLSHSAPSPLLVLSRSSSPSPLPVLSQFSPSPLPVLSWSSSGPLPVLSWSSPGPFLVFFWSTPGLSRFWDQSQANSALYSAFRSVEQTDFKNVIIENIF